MSLIEMPDLEQGTEEWHEQRLGIVTASTVGALLTDTRRVADNQASRGLTARLTAERIAGFAEDTPTTFDMWRGIDSEPIARDLYSQRYQPAKQYGFMRRDEDWGSLGFSPDGVVGKDGLIEIKAPRAKQHVLTILADEVPAQYMAQCQAGLFVSGRKWIDFVSFCGGLPLYVKRVEASDEWASAIAAAVAQFETNVADLIRDYTQRADGLMPTERVDHNNVELKLA